MKHEWQCIRRQETCDFVTYLFSATLGPLAPGLDVFPTFTGAQS